MANETAPAQGNEELKVFVSYSRADLAFVNRLDAALGPEGIKLYTDRHDIEAFEDWRARITELIAASDTVLLVLSPDSVVSESCRKEVDIATRLNKRFAPIIARDIGNAPVPAAVERINYIFFRNVDDFAGAVTKLVGALRSDLAWIREHSRYGDLARRWEAGGEPSDQLLHGAEIGRAERWAARPPQYAAPEPTATHRRFIEASVLQREKQHRNEGEAISALSGKIALHIKSSDLHRAADELDEAVAYFVTVTDTELATRKGEFAARRDRMRRVVGFLDAARSVYVLAGQEEFGRAREACETALTSIGALADRRWWLQLPTEDLDVAQRDQLKYEAHRQLLLLCALRLQPGIDKITPKSKPSFDVTRVLRFVPGYVVKRFALAGGLDLLPALRKRDNAAAAADFELALATLAKVREFEAAHAADRDEVFPPSRTGRLIAQMGELLLAFSSGPKGEKIGYRRLLQNAEGTTPGSPADALNPADYYFLGLFNFFVAKRRDATVAKLFSVFQGVFPDLDSDTPFDTAERLLRTGVSREPSNFWPHFVLGRTLLARGDFNGAELAFNACISIDSTYARGFEQRALALAGQYQEHRYEEVMRRAQDDSGRALELAGDDPSTYWPRGELLEQLGLDRDALDAFNRWMQLEENVLGKLSRGTGVQKAHDLAQSLLDGHKVETDHALRAECFALLALVHFLWGQQDQARTLAAKALQDVPSHAHAHTVLGLVHLHSGQNRAAIAEFDAAVQADPAAWLAMLRRAEASDAAAALPAWRNLESVASEIAAVPGWMRSAAQSALTRLTSQIERHDASA
jgi:tetratricopeptide (TPR) repeat protein